MAHQRPREMRLSDVTVDSDGKPLIGTPLGRRRIVLNGCFASEEYRHGKLVGWHDKDKTQPILQYQNGELEVLFSLSETNWKST